MPAGGSPSTSDLTRAVKQHAYRLGFSLVGVTTPEPPPHLDVYAAWLQAGRHGQMAYLASERALQRRRDPRLILPECQSILVLALPYTPPAQAASLTPTSLPMGEGSRWLPSPLGGGAGGEGIGQDLAIDNPLSAPESDALPLSGLVAAYAWGDDYHDVLPPLLRALVTRLETQVGHPVPNRWYTDTGPLLERELAQRAGLGWIGKNTCLINPQQGSYFLLAEVLLGIALEPDPPFAADRCGSCTRCLDACPTQCILPDRTLDARRCISYLTIELKDSIPLELRPLTGAWVFGCDVCQQVCPWNQRFAAAPAGPPLAPRPDLPQPELTGLLALAPQEFSQRFKGSPLKRTRRGGLLRNAAIALGNRARRKPVPAAVEALAKALADPEPLVRQHAAWALGELGGPAARRALEQAAVSESDDSVLAEIRMALQ